MFCCGHSRDFVSQLYLCDLAGSERVKKSGVTGTNFDEATAINSSLLVLGKVISALSRSETHVPYYECKLTTLLKKCFGGNSRTAVVVTCRSDDTRYGDETLQSLRFGERCAMISNQVRQAAASKTEVQAMLQDALTKVDAQLLSLQSRNKQHLASFSALQVRKDEIKLRLESLLQMMKI